MRHLLLLACVTVFLVVNIIAQKEVANKLSMSKYMLNDETYIPYPDSFVVSKTLKVRLIFIHYSEEDPRNFDANNPEHVLFLDQVFKRVNERYASLWNKDKCDDFIPNTQIQFRIVERINIIAPEKWDNGQWGENAASSASNGVRNLHEWLPSQGIERDAINCVFTEAACWYNEIMNNEAGCDSSIRLPLTKSVSASSPFPSLKLKSGSTNHYRNKYINWYQHNNNGYCDSYPDDCCPSCPEVWQTTPVNFIHEIGHSIWGPHVNNGCNHIMNNSITGTYFSKRELGKIHRAFSVMNTRSLVDGCPKSEIPIIIDSHEIWRTDYRSYNDIVIKEGGHLEISNRIWMPVDGKIKIEQGGKLTLDDGIIANACDENWDGIQIIPEKAFLFFKTTKRQLAIIGESELRGNNYAVKKIRK